jgi:Na+-transporting NADH:ubiquinone oxidoreductase subunit NqrD
MVLDTGTVLIALFPVEVAAGSVYFWILPVIAIVGLLIGGGKTVYSLTSQRAQEKAERRKYATLQVCSSSFLVIRGFFCPLMPCRLVWTPT